MSAFRFHETPKDAALFARVSNVVLVDGSVALDAMRVRASMLGYQVRSLGAKLSGEASALAVDVIKMFIFEF